MLIDSQIPEPLEDMRPICHTAVPEFVAVGCGRLRYTCNFVFLPRLFRSNGPTTVSSFRVITLDLFVLVVSSSECSSIQ